MPSESHSESHSLVGICLLATLCIAANACTGGDGNTAASRPQAKDPATTAPRTATPQRTPFPGPKPLAPAAAKPPPILSKPLPPMLVDSGKVYALLDPGEPTASISQFASMASVDGLVYRAVWSKLESTPGSFDWSTLDTAADITRAAGKRLTVHIFADLPGWLPGLGAQTYSYTSPIRSGTAAVPWDSTYLRRHGDFMTALAAHVLLRGDADVLSVVSVGAPVSEMTLVGCQNGMLGNTIAYDRSKYLGAWETSVASHRYAFSNGAFSLVTLVVSAPVSEICRPDGDGTAFYAELMNRIQPIAPGTGMFFADLNALGSARLAQVSAGTLSQSKLYFQTIWSYTDDPTNRFKGPLRDGICHGWRAGSRYFEIYKPDLLNTDPAVVSAIAAARTGAGC